MVAKNGTNGTGRFGDPTANVIALVEAIADTAAKLRESDQKYNDSQYAHLKEISALRADKSETLRLSDLDRLDKTRQVDVLAATASAAALATAVQTLATTTDRNADTLRNQLQADRAALAKLVADTATTLSTQNDGLMKDVNTRIQELQKSQYQGAGKSSVADPLMAEFIAEMRTVVKHQDTRTGKAEGVSMVGAIAMGAVALIGGLLGIAGVLYAVLSRSGVTP